MKKKKSKTKHKKDEWDDCDDCAICRAMKEGRAGTVEELKEAFLEAEMQGGVVGFSKDFFKNKF